MNHKAVAKTRRKTISVDCKTLERKAHYAKAAKSSNRSVSDWARLMLDKASGYKNDEDE